ncbi:plasmid recombination protein [Pseudooceanicola nitratireducens]|uniref:plasmid recombination protein n=1 Tax=Pseudooceanicola nitratireducens TaxID=517719 RepID=UPI003C79D516
MATSQTTYPIVLRMQGMWPKNIRGYEKHRLRLGGDLGHIDPSKSHENNQFIGDDDWATRCLHEIEDMRLSNHARTLEALERRRRTTELQTRLAEGPRDPWRPTRHGPMREIILTANKEWFAPDQTKEDDGFPTRAQSFEIYAKQWLLKHFGDDCVHARSDHDEEAFHIHAIIMPRATTKDGRRVLQPSVHPIIRHYEKAQDEAGIWFSQMGLTRGERRKQAFCDAVAHNKKVREAEALGDENPGKTVPLPKYRLHVTPRKYRQRKECEFAAASKALDARAAELKDREAGLAKREEAVVAREADADAVLDLASDVAEGRLDAVALATSDDAQSDDPALSPRLTKAKSLFGKAIANLRQRARDELGQAFAEIKNADAEIVRLAKQLPRAARDGIAQMRRSLSRSIVGLERDPAVPKHPDVRDERKSSKHDPI